MAGVYGAVHEALFVGYVLACEVDILEGAGEDFANWEPLAGTVEGVGAFGQSVVLRRLGVWFLGF